MGVNSCQECGFFLLSVSSNNKLAVFPLGSFRYPIRVRLGSQLKPLLDNPERFFALTQFELRGKFHILIEMDVLLLNKKRKKNLNGFKMKPLKEAAVYSITVKKIPADIYESLKHSAKVNRRSINSEIIVIIEEAVQSKRILPEEFLVRARQIREKTANFKITDDEFKQAKEAGR